MRNKISVLFDTNSYRELVRNKSQSQIHNLFEEINFCEKNKNIEPLSVFTVLLELMSNLVEGEDSINYENCLKALQFLTNHCFNEKNEKINIVDPPFLQMSSMLFGALPIDYNTTSKTNSKVFEKFRLFESTPKISYEVFNFVKTNIQNQEMDFAKSLKTLLFQANLFLESKYPNSTSKFRKKKLLEFFATDSYAQRLAEKAVILIAKDIESDISENEIFRRGYYLRKELPLSIYFFQWMLSELITKNINLDSNLSKAKRWNWIWDYQISFIVSNNTINNGKIILVTNDKEIIEILRSQKLHDFVMTLKEYLKFIGLKDANNV